MNHLLYLLFAVLLFLQSAALQAQSAIEGLSDLDLGQVPPTSRALRAHTTFCVSLDPRGRYQITATGDAPGGQFALLGSGGAALVGLPYRVFVSDRGRRRGVELRPALPSSGLRPQVSRRDGSCRPPLARVTVRVDARALRRARPGRYRGTLSLTVAPE